MIPLEQLCAAHHGAELLMLRSAGEQQQSQLSKEDSQGGESEGATTTTPTSRRKSTSTTSILLEESSVTTPTILVDEKSSSSNLVDTPSYPTNQPKHADPSATVNNNNAAPQTSSSSSLSSSSQRRKSSATSSSTSPLLPSQSTKMLCPFGPDCRFVHVCREELRVRLLRLPHNRGEQPQPLDDIRKGQHNIAGGGSSGDNNETSAINNSVVIGSVSLSARHSSAFDSEYEKVADVDFTLMTPSTPHNFAGKHLHNNTSAAQATSSVTVATPQHGGVQSSASTGSAAGISLRVVIDDTPIVPMTRGGGP
ncbi:Hypothetical protein, putative, partial [Bodo saltans]